MFRKTSESKKPARFALTGTASANQSELKDGGQQQSEQKLAVAQLLHDYHFGRNFETLSRWHDEGPKSQNEFRYQDNNVNEFMDPAKLDQACFITYILITKFKLWDALKKQPDKLFLHEYQELAPVWRDLAYQFCSDKDVIDRMVARTMRLIAELGGFKAFSDKLKQQVKSPSEQQEDSLQFRLSF